MQRCASMLSFAALALAAPLAPAQELVQRTFPANALRGELRLLATPEALLNGKPARLAPGARVRDGNNIVVSPASLAGGSYSVHYTLELHGLLLDVWLLRPDEKARQPWPTSEAEARAWKFDWAAQTWTRP